MALFIRGGVDRANIKNFFPMGVRKSLIGKGQAAQNNQEDANRKNGLHIAGFLN
jgi:hypothetical protein